MKRTAVFCPGRGSYTEASLGSLPAGHPFVERAEELRRAAGLESLVALDSAERFEPGRHLKPSNVSLLIYVASMIDGVEVLETERVVCVGGNSLGWYTSLALAGSLSFEDGFRLVQTMALLQEDAGGGGQVLYPLIDADWIPSAELTARVERVMQAAGGDVMPSIHLGGFTVLAGNDAGVARLLRDLEKHKLGKVTYPFRLAQHGPYHTSLVAGVAQKAKEQLASLTFEVPRVTLIDGRGARFTPFSTDLEALADYTLGAQVVTPYDFTTSVRVALCEYAPERISLLRPGNTLGGICGQVLVAERWAGVASKADFDELQAGPAPLIDSRGR